MTASLPENQEQIQDSQKQNDKDYNFAQIRRQLEQERVARQQAEERATQAERAIQERSNAKNDDDDDEPYVDSKS